MQGDILRPQHLGVEYMCLDSMGFAFKATCLNAHDEKIQVSQDILDTLVDVVKAFCSCLKTMFNFIFECFFNSIILN